MSLYSKTLLIITTILLALIVFLYIVAQHILLTSYRELERQEISGHVQRVLNTIVQEQTRLATQNGDYAHWDDTYTFIQDGNPDYIDSNLIDGTFTSLGINLMAFIDRDGGIVYAKAVNLLTEEAYEIPADIRTFLEPESPLMNLPDELTGVQGIVMSSEGPMLISSQAILTSQMEGPSAGTLIMGYLLDDTRIQQLSETLQLSLTIMPVDNPQLTADFRTARMTLNQPDQPDLYIAPLDVDRVGGYAMLNDLFDEPALLLRVDIARSIFSQGQTSLSILLLALSSIGLIFMITMLILLERLVLRRLSHLSATLRAIRESGDHNRRTLISGKDELATLAGDINATLEKLAQTRNELQRTNEELEARVHNRTRELTATNRQLATEISQHQQTQAKLAEARDQAVEALNLKDRLLANISHDARTPLTVINLRTEMLKTGRYGPVNEKQIETLDSILVNASQLLSFINDLLDESQSRATAMKINTQVFQPQDLLHEVAVTVTPLVERKGLTFQTHLDPELPENLLGDPERLRQVLTNLVENAIKFTDKGSIRVRLFKQDADHWSLQVSDTGIGIPVDAQTRIFEAFWQVTDIHTPSENHGVGLGLSIVKLITDLMGGNVRVESQPGQGSTFSVVLPIIHAQPESIG